MARQLWGLREKLTLPPLPCVTLSNVVGGYWRFQEVGQHAVSTIEAIAHTMEAAMTSSSSFSSTTIISTSSSLLLLFKLQRYRVLSNIEEGNKPPRAMVASGSGEGGWEEEIKGLAF